MTRQDPAKARPRGGLADKRRAILAGALTVFARDGYTRASIDAISAQAGVSTRTIYNHFQDKAQLFQSVIQESAAKVAAAQAAIIAWQETGPLRVRRELAGRLRTLAGRGLLRIDDPERAALHLMMLVSTYNPSYRAAVPSEAEITEMVTTGVRAFLYGYAG